MRILITGGAGFVGSNLAVDFKEAHPNYEVVALDNLKRRGSELNLPRFKKLGIEFFHGDIRQPSDLEDLPGNFDLFIEASAEPSVLAGLNGDPRYLINTNLMGTVNCLEFARHRAPQMIFLSTSRVYSMGPLRAISLEETESRFEISPEQKLPGVSPAGIKENFPTHLARSLYGATKLASEQLIQEYVNTYSMKAIINRCGVICGPGQFGKVDQGVFTLWVANHFYSKSLRYTGFGGTGKQVRDLLHPRDLYSLIEEQSRLIPEFNGEIFNVGGGREISTSLRELTQLCQLETGNQIEISADKATNPVDIPLYVTDNSHVQSAFDWQPKRSIPEIVSDIFHWLRENEEDLRPIFG